MQHKRKPVVALCGLAFKPNIDDLRESPASFIVEKIINSNDPSYFNIVEPNISFHNKFEIVKLEHAVLNSDIIALLVRHDEFVKQDYKDLIVLNFCNA